MRVPAGKRGRPLGRCLVGRGQTGGGFLGQGNGDGGEAPDLDQFVAARPRLADHLEEQTNLILRTQADRLIARHLIDNLNEAGYLVINGRGSDLIITGGFNVYPKEIEEKIDAMPGVVESAVVGLPHADFGEAVTAIVVAQKDAALDAAKMIAELKTGLAGFKVPKAIHFVDELPRNAMGKVQKKVLRETFG